MTPRTVRLRLRRLYGRLMEHYGPQGWWPTTPPEGTRPRYYPGDPLRSLTDEARWEIAAGAILTQNTAWRNAEQALVALTARGARQPRSLLALGDAELATLLRPSGYYNQKARRLRGLAAHVVERHGGRLDAWLGRPPGELRGELLGLDGIGPETADCILLYAAGYPFFVIDAFTRRICSRLGLVDEGVGYGPLQELFTQALPAEAAAYNECHALLVRHAVVACRARPRCEDCPLRRGCSRGRQETPIDTQHPGG
ncbi:MAG: hypothetical protein ABIL09_10040 [Gemmatimonadota bacterium]